MKTQFAGDSSWLFGAILFLSNGSAVVHIAFREKGVVPAGCTSGGQHPGGVQIVARDSELGAWPAAAEEQSFDFAFGARGRLAQGSGVPQAQLQQRFVAVVLALRALGGARCAEVKRLFAEGAPAAGLGLVLARCNIFLGARPLHG